MTQKSKLMKIMELFETHRHNFFLYITHMLYRCSTTRVSIYTKVHKILLYVDI